jgi:hypothetical protein
MKMQNSMEESVRSRRQIKRIVIAFAIIEVIVTVFMMFYMVKK